MGRCNRNAPFGERLRILREAIGATQGELAEKLGITRQTISLYENGERYPDVRILENLVNLTGVSAGYLLCVNDNFSDRYLSIDRIMGLEEETLMHLQIYPPDKYINNILCSYDFDILVKLIGKYAEAAEFFDDSFDDAYNTYLCHNLLNRIIAEARETGYKSITEEEWEQYQLKQKQKFEKIEQDLAEKRNQREKEWDETMKEQVKAEWDEMKKNADKFSRFRDRMIDILLDGYESEAVWNDD